MTDEPEDQFEVVRGDTGRTPLEDSGQHQALRPEAELMPSAREAADARVAAHQAAVRSWEEVRRARRRHIRTSLILFFATLLSTFLVGSQYAPLNYFAVHSSQEAKDEVERAILKQALRTNTPPVTIDELFREQFVGGLQYAISLMVILLSHEMGHYLVAVRNRVPASLPYFIPLPLPPLGTMGAVILQGRGAANRVQMFDIAVCGPLAGLFMTLPVLWYGIYTSGYAPVAVTQSTWEFGEPLILQWMIQGIHGIKPPGEEFILNSYALAGWVGVFITALNLLPVGQLDGGHILYTLIGKTAHLIAWGVIGGLCFMMWYIGTIWPILIVILLVLTGVRHPPTANDSMPLGAMRQCVGWATLAFLIIGFTPQPIMVLQPRPQAEATAPDPGVAQYPSDILLDAEAAEAAAELPGGEQGGIRVNLPTDAPVCPAHTQQSVRRIAQSSRPGGSVP